jgi:hypothetical protein
MRARLAEIGVALMVSFRNECAMELRIALF